MYILISNLLSVSIFDFGKWSNWKYAYLRIFSLTTSQSQNLIPKADLKWECTYFYSRFFFEEFWSVFQKVKKWISHCIFKKWFDRGRVSFLTENFSEKAKLPKICLSFGGSMPEGQFKKCPLTPPSIWYMRNWLTHWE